MTVATFLFRYRRVLVLCVATVLLHAVALGWLAPQLGSLSPPAAQADVPAIVAQLHTAQAAPEAPPPAPPPAVVRKRPRAKPAAQPRPAPAPPLANEAASVAPADAPVDEAAMSAPAERGAAAAEADVKSAGPAPAPPTAEAPPAPAAPAEAGPRRYKTSPPPPAELSLAVSRTDADGTLWNGEAVIAWKLNGAAYTMTVEAGIRVIFARVNLVVLNSEGTIGEDGFVPVTMTEKRRGRSMTATHFNQKEGRISFSASPYNFPLPPGTQDKATVPLQLAAIARADPGQLDGNVEIMVGEDKDASLFRFVVLGQEEIDTRMGKMQTWHLSRPPRPGAYGSRLDVWLAPGHDWYPVQIRNSEANGAVTTQTISKIVVMDSAR